MTDDNTIEPAPKKAKAPAALLTVLMPAIAADPDAGTPARSVYLATMPASDVPADAAVIGTPAGANEDGTIALISPDTGLLEIVPAADLGLYPNHAHAVAGIHFGF
jgi:hypothetical protein